MGQGLKALGLLSVANPPAAGAGHRRDTGIQIQAYRTRPAVARVQAKMHKASPSMTSVRSRARFLWLSRPGHGLNDLQASAGLSLEMSGIAHSSCNPVQSSPVQSLMHQAS